MDKTKPDHKTWRDIPPMPVCWYPSSLGNPTGGWRTFRPVIHMDKCIHCAVCWESCPDAAVRWVEGSPEVDYEACKGCGICAYECPVKTIEMVLEVKA
jgi:2-oxoacid:acceptor oxidoreductase delta subunit (pyruvate/2-ketoisovalerate family)